MVYTLITLYPSSETEFSTNGLGSLGEAARCIVTEEANGSFELELIYPITGRRYKDLTNRAIIFAKPNPVDPPQPFRIYEISRPMNGLVTFYAAHISYDLSGYPIRPFKASSAVGAMDGLKTHSVSNHPFTFWTDKNVVSEFSATTPMATRSALGGVKGSILDTYGGEYKFDRFNVKLYTHRGDDRGVTIRYGKNLTDLNQEENCSNVYTGVLPYWRDEDEDILVQLPEAIVPTAGIHDFTNIYTLDLTSEFQDQPTVETLRSRTQKYIKDNRLGIPKVSLTVSFVQLEQTEEYENLQFLERVELFDTVTVEFPEMSVSSTAKICRTVYNVLTGRYDSVTIGEVRASISDTIIYQDDEMTEIANEAKSQLRREVDKATDWIINGRGYMVAVKDEAGNWMEICSLDTPNIDTAVNVWRWNNGGFGHSSHGYGGPYDVAITQDGHIVADFITTGTLTASLIKAGILKSNDEETFYLDLEAGILKMKATEFSIEGKTVAEISKDVSDRSITDFYDLIYAPEIQKLQLQIDGQIESWYYDHEPTLNNEPASSWTTEAERQRHQGDMFYWTSKGYSYRFFNDGNTWKWQMIADSDIAKALAGAAQAQDTADSKRRVFIVKPEPPYDAGDLWFPSSTSDIMTCIFTRTSGSFDASDWEKRNKYIDQQTAKDEAKTAVDAQTQQSIFNKLTNNGRTQGIYMNNGLVYINASYIKAGVLTDGKGNNTWDLVNGTLVAKNITAYGSFRCGSPNATTYTILDEGGALRGYRNSAQVGYIDYTSSVWNVDNQRTEYGIQMQANGIIRITTPTVSVRDSSNVSDATYHAKTVEINQKLITSFNNLGGGKLQWQTGSLYLRFENGLLIASQYTA